jgi:glycosyltransferase involved in cell wall biosynthesis
LAALGHKMAHIPMGFSNQMGRQVYKDVLVYNSDESSPFGEGVAEDCYIDFKADMLITNKEPWVFQHIHTRAMNFVPMSIIDHAPVSSQITSRLTYAYKVIAISKFGQRELKKKGIESVHIPLGCLDGNTLIYVRNKAVLGEKQGKSCDSTIKGVWEIPLLGKLVKISTCNRSLKITQDNDVLSSRGWVPAGNLVVGDAIAVVDDIDTDLYTPVSIKQYVDDSAKELDRRRANTDEKVSRGSRSIDNRGKNNIHRNQKLKYEEVCGVELCLPEGGDLNVYDLMTETENFVANGVVVHNCRTDIYKPLPKAECKKAWALKPDDFVVGVVCMNRARKMIPQMLRGYKRFIEQNPDIKTKMLLWTNVLPSRPPADVSQGVADVGVHLLPEICDLGLGDYINWIKWDDVEKMGGIPDFDPAGRWDMARLYNSFDVNLLCSGGEGAGLTYLEAAACGVPSVYTNYAAAPEYAGPSGIPVNAENYVIINTPGTRYYLADVDGIADGLRRIYDADRAKLALRCRAFAEKMSWENVIRDYWAPFLRDAEQDLYPRITKEGTSSWA